METKELYQKFLEGKLENGDIVKLFRIIHEQGRVIQDIHKNTLNYVDAELKVK